MGQNGNISTGVTLCWRDEIQLAVAVSVVVPPDELLNPLTRSLQACEALAREIGSVLECPEQ